ncbi:hypothetical protein mRhiFer1_008535 [Rhinolophus ferrumequinum]|uniref:Uncharacterized protein n=1 Tax=Rhinolophus ferrumequinum TaxID=59479 RepID=A0A7J7UX58_RHIFE|nr:hypothetical protein mRhiFer1_008535 [Rhinolophus ferrumequinum]
MLEAQPQTSPIVCKPSDNAKNQPHRSKEHTPGGNSRTTTGKAFHLSEKLLGVLAPSSLALPVPETKQKPLSLDTGSPPQARTAFAFLGGPVCSLMASAKAPPTPPPVPTVLVSSQGTHSPVGATWTVDLSLGSVHCTYPDSVC